VVATVALATTLYVERDGEILLLRRAGDSAFSGQWFLPGGGVEEGETPEEGARRELLEEAGLTIDGELELVGAYPMWVYGGATLALSYRGRAAAGEVVTSDEHDGARWVDPRRMRATLTDRFIADLAAGDERAAAVVQGVRDDLDRYLRRVGPENRSATSLPARDS
jgi:8-oxo-dGTP pyrophosphatase MutT (NUDIX family)